MNLKKIFIAVSMGMCVLVDVGAVNKVFNVAGYFENWAQYRSLNSNGSDLAPKK